MNWDFELAHDPHYLTLTRHSHLVFLFSPLCVWISTRYLVCSYPCIWLQLIYRVLNNIISWRWDEGISAPIKGQATAKLTILRPASCPTPPNNLDIIPEHVTLSIIMYSHLRYLTGSRAVPGESRAFGYCESGLPNPIQITCNQRVCKNIFRTLVLYIG